MNSQSVVDGLTAEQVKAIIKAAKHVYLASIYHNGVYRVADIAMRDLEETLRPTW